MRILSGAFGRVVPTDWRSSLRRLYNCLAGRGSHNWTRVSIVRRVGQGWQAGAALALTRTFPKGRDTCRMQGPSPLRLARLEQPVFLLTLLSSKELLDGAPRRLGL